MKSYQDYVEISNFWISSLPKNWSLRKASYSFDKIGSGTTPRSDNLEYYENGTINWINTGDLNDDILFDCSKKITAKAVSNYSTLKLYPKGTVIIALYGATIGKLSLLDIEGTTNQACCALSESKFYNNKFTFYFLLAARPFILSLSYGGGQPNISQDLIKNLRIVTPSLPEQTTIANFLDYKTKLIDKLIAQKEKQIELLKEYRQGVINQAVTKGLNPNVKMKDSGIEWLGKIPGSWEVKKLGYVSKLFGRIGFRGYQKADLVEEGEGAITLGGKNLDSNNRLSLLNPEYISWEKFYESPEIMVKSGDVIVAQRGTLGKVVYIEDDIGKATINPSLILLKDISLNPKYLYYFLLSNFIIETIKMNNTATAVPMLSQEQLSNFKILCPPSSIQKEIVEYLSVILVKIDLLSERVRQQRIKLKEYRASLISSAVTGKIDVRDYKIPEEYLEEE